MKESNSMGEDSMAKPKAITAVRRNWSLIQYVMADALASAFAWAILFMYRKRVLEYTPAFQDSWIPKELFEDGNFAFGLFFVPMFWVGVVRAGRDAFGPIQEVQVSRSDSGVVDHRLGLIDLVFRADTGRRNQHHTPSTTSPSWCSLWHSLWGF